MNQLSSDLKNKNDYFIYCNNCFQIPLITLSLSERIIVNIICSGKNRILLLSDYLKEIKSSSPSKNCEETLEHYNTKAICYCKTCKKYLCFICKRSHLLSNPIHVILPNNINTNIMHIQNNHDEHFYEIAFCYKCVRTICLNCETEHIGHNYIRITDAMTISISERVEMYNQVKRSYKQLLIKTMNEAIKSYQRYAKEIRKSCIRCIKRNKKIMDLILILLNNQKIIAEEGICFQTISNFVKNTNFTIFNGNYKKISNRKSAYHYIKFFNSFNVIEEDHSFGEYNDLYHNKDDYRVELFPKQTAIRITAITKMNNILILGSSEGNLYLYHIASRAFCENRDAYYIHDDKINGFIAISNSKLISYSDDYKIKIIEINPTVKIISTIEYHKAPISSLKFYPKEETIVSASKNGHIVIFSIKESDDFLVHHSIQLMPPYSIKYVNAFLLRNKTTLIALKGDLLFFFKLFTVNAVMQKSIKGITSTPNSLFYETKEGKLLIGGYYQILQKPKIIVINLKYKEIETIVDLHINWITEEYFGAYSLLKEDEDSFYILTYCSRVICMNKHSFIIKKKFIKNFKNPLIATIMINRNEYVSLSTESDLIFWKLGY